MHRQVSLLVPFDILITDRDKWARQFDSDLADRAKHRPAPVQTDRPQLPNVKGF